MRYAEKHGLMLNTVPASRCAPEQPPCSPRLAAITACSWRAISCAPWVRGCGTTCVRSTWPTWARTPAEIGAVIAIATAAGGLLPLPAGWLTDRIGPRRVLICAWLLVAASSLAMGLATSWPVLGLGLFAYSLSVASGNPAAVAYVSLNIPEDQRQAGAEPVMALVFGSWPAAMIVAPMIGGALAGRFGIPLTLVLGAVGFVLAVGCMALGGEVRAQPQAGARLGDLLHNRAFLRLVPVFALIVVALNVGTILAPNFLQDARGLSTAAVGLLYSVFSVGTLAGNVLVARVNPRLGTALLMIGAWLAMLGLWLLADPLPIGAAYLALGGIPTMWVLAQAAFSQVVRADQRGLASGMVETIFFMGTAAASLIAGQLYDRTPAHDLPLLAGLAGIGLALVVWFLSPERQSAPVKIATEV